MKRVALLCSEPIRKTMAGIGVRYLEFARRLPGHDLEVVLFTAGDPCAMPELPSAGVQVRALRPGSIARDLQDCDTLVVQGGLGDIVLREAGDLPAVVDLYDPWLVENLHYYEDLGSVPYQRDHRSWTLQLSRGDFFLCSSPGQRAFYLGWLLAVGRMTPQLLVDDPGLESLIGLVPFGIAERIPAHRPVMAPRVDGEQRILFGGLYDWLDPWPALEAMTDRPGWRLLLVRNPNPDTTPQRRWREVEQWCRERGWWCDRVQAIDWVPADRRFDVLRDVDVLVVSHRDGPETWLSLRTRVLDALAAGCPVVVSDGGGTAELLRRHGVGTIVPPGDGPALTTALDEVLGVEVERPSTNGAPVDLTTAMGWDHALQPLVQFCRHPRRHPTRVDAGHRIHGILQPLRNRVMSILSAARRGGRHG